MISNCDVDTFPLVSWARCGACLYRFLIFALFLAFMSLMSAWGNFSFVFLPCLECRCTSGEGFSISLMGTTFPWYSHIGTLVVSQSVKQFMPVDPFPLILANVVDIQKENLLLRTPVLNKTPRLSSARMFVRLYKLLLIHCIYVSVTKPTRPAFSAWLNTGSIRSLKVTGRAILLCSMALTIKVMCNTTWLI